MNILHDRRNVYMNLQQLVQAFNALPRPPQFEAPSGLAPNHWQFSIHHVDVEPAGDVVYLFNPQARFAEGKVQILSAPSVLAQADIILPILLEAFVRERQGPHGSVESLAPWSWGTGDEALAKALESRLKAAGVRSELCHVSFGDEEKIKIQNEEWSKIHKNWQGAAGPKCHTCKQPAAEGKRSLLRCGGCRMSQYCSKECQKGDWKTHKVFCKSMAEMGTAKYFETAVQFSTLGRALANEIGLKGSPSLAAIIRRLVATGKDTPRNITILIGPHDKNKDLIQKLQHESRMEILLGAPPGSPAYALAHSLKMDENCPPWTPREASAEETGELQEIKELQDRIRAHMGSRSMKDLKTSDMQAVLTSFGASWTEMMPRYQSAINAMDQGVRAD